MGVSDMRVSVLLFVTFIVQGCATFGGSESDVGMSEALKIARAGGFDDIKDISREDLNKAYTLKTNKNGSTVARASMAAGTATGFYAPPPGFSKGASAGLLGVGAALSFFSSNRGPESFFRIFAWMPKDYAATEDDARVKLREMYKEAYSKVLPNHQVSIVHAKPPKSKINRPKWYIKITGEECIPECGVHGPSLNYEDPKLEESPSFVGGKQTWTWKYSFFSRRGLCCYGYPPKHSKYTPAQRVEFLKQLSKHLPSWLYIYTPPGNSISGLPQIYSSGKQMFFIQPEVQDKTKTNISMQNK